MDKIFWICLIVFILIVIVGIFCIYFDLFKATSKPSITGTSKKKVKVPKVAEVKEEQKVAAPQKKKWRREELCRKILEDIYDEPFPSVRPNFLKNPETGHNLELDCYNDHLKIALEHNGEQHYNFPNAFHKTREEFKKGEDRDKTKKKICEELGIKLVIVPFHIPEYKLETFIQDELAKD